MKRVVVTGMGAVTPIGNNVEEFWDGIKKNKVGIGEITKFDVSEYKCKMGAEVKDFDPKQYMDPKAARRMEPFCQYAVAATGEAIKNAGIDLEKEDLSRFGTCIGNGLGGVATIEKEHAKVMNGKANRVSVMMVPMMISNMAAGNVAIAYGLKGKCTDVVTACATGTNSIGEAYRYIQVGDADVMVAGGAESPICETNVSGFISMTALSSATEADRASIPFDKDRCGFVIGEGAGVVVLESLEHAQARGAKILAEVVGYGSTCDAFHITSPAEDGEGAARAMILAINEAGITPADVDYINAHGTSTHHNDLYETRAIKKAFGEDAYNVNINSTKSMIGHLFGAAGAVEFITCVKSIEDGYIHPTVGLRETEGEIDLNYTKGEGVHKDITYALSNSLGFGGHNASILVKKWEE